MSLLPNCKEVHRLVVEDLDRDLGALERLRLRFHLLICDACTNFGRQMALLRAAMRGLGNGDRDDGRRP